MKIYVSVPITGRPLQEARQQADNWKKYLTSDWNEPITPFDVCSDEEEHPYSYYMGRDIEALLECDAIIMTEGWEKSRGCNLEYSAANLYGLKVFTHEDFKRAGLLL